MTSLLSREIILLPATGEKSSLRSTPRTTRASQLRLSVRATDSRTALIFGGLRAGELRRGARRRGAWMHSQTEEMCNERIAKVDGLGGSEVKSVSMQCPDAKLLLNFPVSSGSHSTNVCRRLHTLRVFIWKTCEDIVRETWPCAGFPCRPAAVRCRVSAHSGVQ